MHYGWSEPFVWLMNVIPITIETNTKVDLNREFESTIKS